MLEYVFPHNIDHRILKRADYILKQQGLIAFPTDSSWSIACSINAKDGIQKLQRMKGGAKTNPPSVLCQSISQMEDIAIISNSHFKMIKSLTPGPYVFILPAKKHIEKKIHMKRVEIGIRIPDHPIAQSLLEEHQNPLLVITASRDMVNQPWWDQEFDIENLYEQGWELEEIKSIDLIIATGEGIPKQLSTVLDLTKDEPEMIRQGVGTL